MPAATGARTTPRSRAELTADQLGSIRQTVLAHVDLIHLFSIMVFLVLAGTIIASVLAFIRYKPRQPAPMAERENHGKDPANGRKRFRFT
jgi:hypothetical protein